MANPYPDALQMQVNVPQMFDGDAQDTVVMVGRVMRPGIVNSVEIIPSWALTGANTNSRTYNLKNRTQAGATIATLALTSGVNLVKGTAKVIPITGTATIAVGDILEWESVAAGTGLPDPGGRIIVQQSLGS